MKIFRPAFRMVLAIASMAACGRDSIVPPPPPAAPQLAMTIVGGNNQSANVRHALTDPLAVAVRTPDGAGVAGATIAWTITAGGGTLSASTSVTDAQGRASVNWSVGSSWGAQTVAAAVVNLDGPPANFSATATAPIVLHYDGTNWTTALEDVNGAGIFLASIWGGTSSEVFAVGTNCSGSLLLRYDGNSWDLPQACGHGGASIARINVWGSSGSDVFSVDRNTATPPWITTTILHYDGQQWNSVYARQCSILAPSPPGSSCFDYIDAVWSRSSTDAFAVGGVGTIKHFDGTNWSPQASGTTNELRAIWGAGSASSVFAVGEAGTIVFYDGNTWNTQTSGTNQPLYAVFGRSANDVFAVGGAGTILHYDGTSWTPQASGSTQTLRGVWGSSGNAVFAVGDNSTILRYDGTKWVAQTTTANMTLRGIWGSSPTNVYAVGGY